MPDPGDDVMGLGAPPLGVVTGLGAPPLGDVTGLGAPPPPPGVEGPGLELGHSPPPSPKSHK